MDQRDVDEVLPHCQPLSSFTPPTITSPYTPPPQRPSTSHFPALWSSLTGDPKTSRFLSLRQPAQTAAGGGSRTEEKIGLSSIRRFVKTNLLATCAMNFDEMHPSVVVLFSDTGAVYMNGL